MKLNVKPSLVVSIPKRSYPIFVGVDIFENVDYSQFFIGNKALIVTDDHIAPILLDRVTKTLSKFADVDFLILKSGETSKNMESLSRIHSKLIENNFDRSSTLIALGGGVIGDITGFAAATYQRGINYIQLPTTLLAQVDSSVGGKTGVNHPLGKNMIGAFHQPLAVVIDISFLSTLSDRQYCSGVAEVIKYGLIKDIDFYSWLIENIKMLKCRDHSALITAVEASIQIKAAVVAADEREENIRAILNFGHTFGHAIESFQRYEGFLHGEAISVGMILAMSASGLLGQTSDADLDLLTNALQQFELPVNVPKDMTKEIFLDYMDRDKKVLDGNIRLILLKSIGHAYLESTETKPLLDKLFKTL